MSDSLVKELLCGAVGTLHHENERILGGDEMVDDRDYVRVPSTALIGTTLGLPYAVVSQEIRGSLDDLDSYWHIASETVKHDRLAASRQGVLNRVEPIAHGVVDPDSRHACCQVLKRLQL